MDCEPSNTFRSLCPPDRLSFVRALYDTFDAALAAISMFSKLPEVARGLARLRAELASGEWRRRYGALPGETALDLGYRLIVADAS